MMSSGQILTVEDLRAGLEAFGDRAGVYAVEGSIIIFDADEGGATIGEIPTPAAPARLTAESASIDAILDKKWTIKETEGEVQGLEKGDTIEFNRRGKRIVSQIMLYNRTRPQPRFWQDFEGKEENGAVVQRTPGEPHYLLIEHSSEGGYDRLTGRFLDRHDHGLSILHTTGTWHAQHEPELGQ